MVDEKRVEICVRKMQISQLAGAGGVAPPSEVLETPILLLNYAPELFCFFVESMFFAPLTKLLELESVFNFFLIFPTIIINPVALGTF